MTWTRYLLRLGMVAAAGGSLALAVPVADAQTTMTASLSRLIGPPGAQLAVHGTSCAANASVSIEFDAQLIGTTTSDGTHAYRATVRVPAAAAAGTHRIWVNAPKCAGWTGGPFVVHTAVSSPGFDARNDSYDPFSTVPPASLLNNLGVSGKPLPSVDMETAGPVWNIAPNSAIYPDYSLVVTDGDRLRTYLNTAPTMDPASIKSTGINCIEPHGRAFQQLLGSDVATGTVVASTKNGIDAFHLGPNGCTLSWSRSGLSCTCRAGYQATSNGFAFFPTDPNSIPNVQILPARQGFVLTSPSASPHTVVAISTTAGKDLWRTRIKGTLTSAVIIYPQPQTIVGTSTGQIYDVSLKTGTRTLIMTAGGSVQSLLTTSTGQVVGKWDSGLVAGTVKDGVEGSESLTAPAGDPVSNGSNLFVVDGDNNVNAFALNGKGLSGPVWNIHLSDSATGRPLLTKTWLGIPTSTGVTFLQPTTGDSLASWVGTPFPASSIVATDGALLVGTQTGAEWIVPL